MFFYDKNLGTTYKGKKNERTFLGILMYTVYEWVCGGLLKTDVSDHERSSSHIYTFEEAKAFWKMTHRKYNSALYSIVV